MMVHGIRLAAVKQWAVYPEYRPTRVWGIDALPSHWQEKPLKRVATINTDKLPDSTDPDFEVEYVDIGNVNLEQGITSTERLRFEAAPSRARRLVRHGDVIVSTVRTYLKAVARIVNPPRNFVVSTGFAVIRSSGELDSGFLYRVAQSEAFVDQVMAYSVGVSYPAINGSEIGQFAVPIPPIDEQERIVRFLEHRTSVIDGLIAKKQLMLDRFAERKAQFISRCVMRGISDSDQRQVDIEWMPTIPAGWQIKRLKFVAGLQTGLTLGKKYGEGAELVARPYLRVANVQDGYLDLEQITTVEVPPADAPRYQLLPGDVLMTEGGDYDKLGRGYVWDGQIEGCLHQNHIFAVRPHPAKLDSHFLATVLSSLHGKNYFTSTSQKTTNLASTNSTKLRSFPVPLPPIEEQRAILEHIRAGCRMIDQAADAVRTAVGKLHELRSSLISAAVTGQIDVRNYRSEASCP